MYVEEVVFPDACRCSYPGFFARAWFQVDSLIVGADLTSVFTCACTQIPRRPTSCLRTYVDR